MTSVRAGYPPRYLHRWTRIQRSNHRACLFYFPNIHSHYSYWSANGSECMLVLPQGGRGPRWTLLTCLVLLAVPGVPGAHQLTGVVGVSVDGRKDIFTEDAHTHTHTPQTQTPIQWREKLQTSSKTKKKRIPFPACFTSWLNSAVVRTGTLANLSSGRHYNRFTQLNTTMEVLPKFVVSIKALRLDIVNCKRRTWVTQTQHAADSSDCSRADVFY